MEAIRARDLYGGAIQVDCPERLVDVSDFRPVPDHQEVLTDANKDQSLIVEIVEHEERAGNSSCSAEFFFHQLADDCEAIQSQQEFSQNLGPEVMPQLPAKVPKSVAGGQMLISKGRQPDMAANRVYVMVAVVQLKDKGSDIIITLNTPLEINDLSSSAAQTGVKPETEKQTSIELFNRMLSTFKIQDWSLFGQEDPA